MTYEEWKGLPSVSKWREYEVNSSVYAKYSVETPWLVVAGHKIADVYRTFCQARGMLRYAIAEDFGELAGPGETNILFVQGQMAYAALLEYAICFDLSWQVIWDYYLPATFDVLMSNEYEHTARVCTLTSVHELLNYCETSFDKVVTEQRQITRVINLLTRFENDIDIMRIRDLYNGVKHRGALHFTGLGSNEKTQIFSVNGNDLPMLHREELEVKGLVDLLYKYDLQFTTFFSKLIDILMPADYTDGKIPLKDIFNFAIQGLIYRDKI